MPALVPTLLRTVTRAALRVKAIKDAKHRVLPAGLVSSAEKVPLLDRELEWSEQLEGATSKVDVLRRVRALFEAEGEAEKDLGSRIDNAFESIRIMTEYEQFVEALVDQGAYKPKGPRNGHIKFRVGDLIQHKYFGKGVVFGWDDQCAASEVGGLSSVLYVLFLMLCALGETHNH